MSEFVPFPIPAFQDNYIWFFSFSKNVTVVVDPGDPSPVLKLLDDKNLSLSHILITHHHPDHTGGIRKLCEAYPSCKVIGPKNPSISGITHPVSEGDTFLLENTQFEVIEIPGHTLDHIGFITKNTSVPWLFCGDTLFSGGCGRMFEGTPKMFHQSLSKLSALPNNTLVYCTHEYTMANLTFALKVEPDNPYLKTRYTDVSAMRERNRPSLPSDILTERDTNPFLRTHIPDVIKSVMKFSNTTPNNNIETFAALRRWKDES